MSELKSQLTDAMKTSMRAGEKKRLIVIRMALAAIKQVEVDERIAVDPQRCLLIIDKMVKQRRESLRQFETANRQDLADQETFEIRLLQEFLPEALSESELANIIDKAIADTGAESIKDMGKVMAAVKKEAQGRADMGKVGASIKARLS